MFKHIELRPYQLDGINRIRDAYRAGFRSPLYVLPTGGGKTYTFSAITSIMQRTGKKVRILVHRDSLLEQCHESLKKLGIQHGIIQGGRTHISRQVEIASVYTLVHRLDRIQPPDLYIIDEAHHVRANTWAKILNEHSSARLLGVTATPCRTDGSGLGTASGGFFDTMVQGPSPSELMELGYLAPYDYYEPPAGVDLSGVGTRAGDFNRSQLDTAMNKSTITGCAVTHYRNIAHKEPAIAFCVSMDHAESVSAEFTAAGYRAKFIHSGLSKGEIKASIRGLGEGRIDVLTSCDLISEGTDIPVCSVGILLRPTHSTGLHLQQVGRPWRPGYNKVMKILDHVGNVRRHGLPDDDRPWELNAVKRKTRKGESDVADMPVKQCPKCYHVHRPQPTCPRCGYVHEAGGREIQTIDGTLKKIDRGEMERMKRERIAKRRHENGRAQSLEELKRVAKERGYARSWPYKMMAVREEKQMKQLLQRAKTMGIELQNRNYSVDELTEIIDEYKTRQMELVR